MTPAAQQSLAKARMLLAEAEAVLRIGLFTAAARSAYLAAFHAAQALIVEKTGSMPKTHNGVHGGFFRLTADDARFDDATRRFLSKAYNYKAVADYETGPDADIPADRAAAAIDQARALVSGVEAALTDIGV